MDERSARRHLKSMLERELLVQHEAKPKWYRLGKYAGKTPVVTVAVEEDEEDLRAA